MTIGPEHFDEVYATAPDPYGFESRWYEQRKYAITLALLPSERYADAFEPGCSIGVLTALLAPRCGRLLAWDGAAAAVQAAARRNAAAPQVRVEQRRLPADWPDGSFDLIVFSELLYYFGDDDLQQILSRAVGSLRPGGTLIAVHWRRAAVKHPRSGADAQAAVGRQRGLARLASYADPDFLAEAYQRADGAPDSVAEAEGLV
jgi:SAM-dependent methyltransferase